MNQKHIALRTTVFLQTTSSFAKDNEALSRPEDHVYRPARLCMRARQDLSFTEPLHSRVQTEDCARHTHTHTHTVLPVCDDRGEWGRGKAED